MNAMIRKMIYTLVLVMLTSVEAFGQTTYVKDGLTYELSGTTAKLWGGDGNKYSNNYGNNLVGNITIPYEIEYGGQTYKVDFCGEYVFQNCKKLGEIYIDSENVPSYSFANANFTKLTFGPHVKTVGDQVFANANFGSGGYTSFNLVFDSSLESTITKTFLTNLGNNVKVSVIFNEMPLPNIETDKDGNSFLKELDKYGNNKGAIVVPEGADLPASWLGSIPAGVTVTDPEGHVYDSTTGEIRTDVIYDSETGTVVPAGSQTLNYDVIDTDISTYPTKSGTGKVTYTRTFANNTDWQAMFLPFTMKYSDWADKVDIAKLINIHRYEDGHWLLELRLVEAGETKANHPYVIRAKSAGTVSIVNTGSTVAKRSVEKEVSCWSTEVKYVFKGVIEDENRWSTIRPTGGQVYIISSGELRRIPEGSTGKLRAFRWYMTMEEQDASHQMFEGGISSVNNIRMRLEGEKDDFDVTAVESMEEDMFSTDNCFNLDGVRLASPRKGLNLVKMSDGSVKKIYVK